MQFDEFENKTILITGAGSGIGAETARRFAKEGAYVYVADLKIDDADNSVSDIKKMGGQACALKLDVSSREDWINISETIIRQRGGLDVLVNSAGISGMVPELKSVDYFDKLSIIHLRGTFLALLHGEKMIDSLGRGGAIVTVSSMAAYISSLDVHMGYSAVKAGILALTRAAGGELASKNIRVNAIVPGLLPPMKTSVISLDPKKREEIFSKVPLGNTGTREHAANAILFLASNASGYTTGSELRLDGGIIGWL